MIPWPCPFCGNEKPEVDFSPGSYGYYERSAKVMCECGASGPESRGDDVQVREQCTVLWNTRKGVL